MSITLELHDAPWTAHAAGMWQGVAGHAKAELRRHLRVWRDRRALHLMPDYLLDDIGTARGEIDFVLEYGRPRPINRHPSCDARCGATEVDHESRFAA